MKIFKLKKENNHYCILKNGVVIKEIKIVGVGIDAETGDSWKIISVANPNDFFTPSKKMEVKNIEVYFENFQKEYSINNNIFFKIYDCLENIFSKKK